VAFRPQSAAAPGAKRLWIQTPPRRPLIGRADVSRFDPGQEQTAVGTTRGRWKLRFSIVINNYNYGRFLAQAIESALAVDWESKEVVVVDDGSTDDSRPVIEQFGTRVVAIFAENGGQARAANIGFAQSTGDVVIFLDADDLLLPSVARQVAAVWGPGIAKVQYGMIFVDRERRPLGREFPVYSERHTPELVSSSMRKTGGYLMSPTSGNAWSRDFLKVVFPMPTRDDGLDYIDLYLNRVAPFFGHVVSLRSSQCLYRRHGENEMLIHARLRRLAERSESPYRRQGENEASVASTAAHLQIYPRQLRQVEAAQRLGDQLLRREQRCDRIPSENEYHMTLALVSKRFFPDLYADRLVDLLQHYWRTVWQGEFSSRWKAALFAWSLIVAAAPRPIAGWFVRIRDQDQTVGNVKGFVRLARLVRPLLGPAIPR
jgi:Glycosyl transferase family 2